MQQVTAESVISCTEVLGPSAARRPRFSMRKSVLRESPQAWAASVIPFSWFFPPMLLASFRDERIIISLKNTGAKAHTVRVAGYADVMIDNNDRAPICATEDGGNTLLMTGAPQNDYAFRLVATTCDTVWYGLWSMRIKECFTDLENRGPDYVYSRDSGLAYSWTATVRPGEEWSRYVLIGTGSEEQMTVEIPQIPVPAPGIPEAEITLNTGEVYLTEGDALPDWNRYIAALQGTLRITGQPADSSTPGSSTVLYTATSSDTAKTARLPPLQAD